ncbi:MAG: hypothetical protein ACLFV2_01630 [Desulfurivibrionaceae bacterium]
MSTVLVLTSAVYTFSSMTIHFMTEEELNSPERIIQRVSAIFFQDISTPVEKKIMMEDLDHIYLLRIDR